MGHELAHPRELSPPWSARADLSAISRSSKASDPNGCTPDVVRTSLRTGSTLPHSTRAPGVDAGPLEHSTSACSCTSTSCSTVAPMGWHQGARGIALRPLSSRRVPSPASIPELVEAGIPPSRRLSSPSARARRPRLADGPLLEGAPRRPLASRMGLRPPTCVPDFLLLCWAPSCCAKVKDGDAMSTNLVICPHCHCHVRNSERACPHCATEYTESVVPRPAGRGLLEASRVAIAAALAGFGTACGGQVTGEPGGAATQADIVGSCGVDGSTGMCGWTTGCVCGPAGICDGAQGCVPKGCAPGEYLNSAGECVSVYWFGGKLPAPASCYGAPPARG
jgi:hypothetical protein